MEPKVVMGSSSSSSLDGYPEENPLGTAVSFEVEKGQVQDPVPGNNSSSSSRCRNSRGRRAQSSGAQIVLVQAGGRLLQAGTRLEAEAGARLFEEAVVVVMTVVAVAEVVCVWEGWW